MEDIDRKEVEKLFTIKRNQLKLVSRRGYDIEREKSILAISLKEFLDAYVPFAIQQNKTVREILSMVYENKEGDKLYVHYADETQGKQSLGVEEVGEAIKQMDKYKAKNGIIITSKTLSSSAKKKIEELVSYNIYIFSENEMTYDPTEHYLTPPHRALSTEEQREFLKRNDLSIEQLPIILITDMIVRYYGFKPGQVIEIKRTNFYETIVQESLSYRVVKEE